MTIELQASTNATLQTRTQRRISCAHLLAGLLFVPSLLPGCNAGSASGLNPDEKIALAQQESDAGTNASMVHGASEPNGETPDNASDLEELSDELERHVVHLAESIGERNLGRYEELGRAADFIEQQFLSWGYKPQRQSFHVRNLECFNIEVELTGNENPEQILVVGAHYDSAIGTPGANDNGSGTASLLALARRFADFEPGLTIRFVAFTNEEPPYFQNDGEMGSWVYAARCRRRNENVIGAISLETMGYFTDEENSQNYPAPLNLFYPSTGNFIGFVSNIESKPFQRRVLRSFSRCTKISCPF